MARIDQRSALQALTKARLLEVAARFDIEVASGRPKSQVIDALASSRRAPFEDILLTLSRDELKVICRAHGLDEGGREKQAIVDRILGREGTVAREVGPGYRALPEELEPKPLEPTRPARGRGAAAKKPKRVAEEGDRDDEREQWAAGTKSRLRRFALAAAAGYSGRDGDERVARDLVRCFGWGPDEMLPAEIPAVVRVVDRGTRREVSLTAMLRERRALVQIVDRDRATGEAWNELLPLVLQLEPVPQYVVVCNQRDVALYDLARSRTEARLSLPVDQLPKYSEAFPFLARDWSPGATPLIINVERVSKEVAELVAKVYRSFKADHPKRRDEVIRFTLQCIIAMFAEDIGLLPREHFTSLLYQAAEHGDAERRLRELFRTMSTPGDGDRAIRYFNGGLFADPVVLPVGRAQLAALTKAAEANWTYVDPHIFGSVFQGIMDDDERHASGAHYTAKEDIMRVVGPTIVEPWRKRIGAATTLAELRALRSELVAFRVLDPACGSGNFLYVAFRELYRLETEILARMREFPSIADDPKGRAAWGSGIPTTNFFGIDINPFAVELARATLNIAKKIAFDERRQVIAERFGQMELELDPSLPLDNLEKNVVCDDALFCDWPKVDAIVGNPPFLGGLKIRAELGEVYLQRLQEQFGDVNGRADLCAYWFRRAHDRLVLGGRAGLVATNTIREANTREAALDYIVRCGGILTAAVSSRTWPGEAVVNVSMVNWVRAESEPGPHTLIVGDRSHSLGKIPTHLQLHVDTSTARELSSNARGTSQGVVFGTHAFQVDSEEALRLRSDGGARFMRPIANAKTLLRGLLTTNPEVVVFLADCPDIATARKAGSAYDWLRREVYPYVCEKGDTYEGWLERWWQPWRPRAEFFDDIRGRHRYSACSRHAARPIFVLLSTTFVPTESLQVFALDDDYSFGVLQSGLHWSWAVANGSKIKDDIRYLSRIWHTLPWPQQPSVEAVVLVAKASRGLREARLRLMEANCWSLRALYQAAEIAGSHPLNDAQAELDEAVRVAYQLPTGQEPMEFLLELNLCLAEDEAEGRPVTGPGLPPGLNARDPRWYSTDCIEPPPLHGKARGARG